MPLALVYSMLIVYVATQWSGLIVVCQSHFRGLGYSGYWSFKKGTRNNNCKFLLGTRFDQPPKYEGVLIFGEEAQH